MKSLIDLTTGDSAWPDVLETVRNAAVPVEILPKGANAEDELLTLQVSTRSTLGAIVYESGGLMLDNRWIRMLGSSSSAGAPGVAQWNGLNGGDPLVAGTLVVAYDVIGGFFVINDDRLPFASGNVCYFAPDSLDWTDMDIGHSDFLRWCCTENVSLFYDHLRWPNWAAEVMAVSTDEALSLYPPPFTSEGKRVENLSRKAVPALELLRLQIHYGQEIGDFAREKRR